MLSAGKRNLTIDIARGISILLIVLAHGTLGFRIPGMNQVLSSFRLPFFFFISGVFFKKELSFDRVLFDKADALLKPFFVTLLLYGATELFRRRGEPFLYLLGLVYGVGASLPATWLPLWFLPHLFSVFIFAWVFIRISRIHERPDWLKGLMLLLLILAGRLVLELLGTFTFRIPGAGIKWSGLPFSLDITLITGAFFICGFLSRDAILRFVPRTSWLLLTIALVALIQYFIRPSLNLNARSHESFFFCLLSALLMIYPVLSLAFFISRMWLRSLFSYLGAMSLFILLFHYIIMMHSIRLFKSLDGVISWGEEAVILAVSVAAPLLIGETVKRIPLLALFFRPLKVNPLFQRRQS